MRGWMQLQCTAETKDVYAQYYDSESFEQRHRPARSSKAADGTLTNLAHDLLPLRSPSVVVDRVDWSS